MQKGSLLREWASGRFVELPQPSGKGWPGFNPSVCAAEGGWKVVVRTANYLLGRYSGVEVPDEECIYLEKGAEFPASQNFLMDFSPQWELRKCVALRDEEQRARRIVLGTGLEDCRLFFWRGGWNVLASCASFTPRNRNVMALFRVGEGGEVGEAWVLHSPEGVEREKNWTPLVAGDDLLLHYHSSPWVVLRVSPGTGALEEEAIWGREGEFWSGSSQWIPWGTGFLGVLHRRVAPLQYRHKLVFMDETLYPVRESPPFSFLHWGVEFCAGLARREGKVAMSFGLGDRQAWVFETPEATVEQIFEGAGQ